jgi:hypothetical protein
MISPLLISDVFAICKFLKVWPPGITEANGGKIKANSDGGKLDPKPFFPHFRIPPT